MRHESEYYSFHNYICMQYSSSNVRCIAFGIFRQLEEKLKIAITMAATGFDIE
jgi:hypothetical protein